MVKLDIMSSLVSKRYPWVVQLWFWAVSGEIGWNFRFFFLGKNMVRKSMCPYYGVGVSQNWGAADWSAYVAPQTNEAMTSSPRIRVHQTGARKERHPEISAFLPCNEKKRRKISFFSPSNEHHRQIIVHSLSPLSPKLEKLHEKSRKNRLFDDTLFFIRNNGKKSEYVVHTREIRTKFWRTEYSQRSSR